MNKTYRWLLRATGKAKGPVFLLTAIQGWDGFFGILDAFLIRGVADSAVGHQKNELFRYVICFAGLILVEIGISAMIQWLHERTRTDIENELKTRLTDQIFRKDYASVSAVHSAEWLNRLTSDTAVVASGITEILPGFTEMLIRLVFALIALFILDIRTSYILIPTGMLIMFLNYHWKNRFKSLHRMIQESDGRLRILLQERISNLLLIKAYNTEKGEEGIAAEAMKKHKAAIMKRNHFSVATNSGMSFAMDGMYLIGLVYGAYSVLSGIISVGTLIAIMQLIGQVQGPFANMAGFFPRWHAATASAERLMEAEQFADDHIIPMPQNELGKAYQEMKSIGFRNACFAYPEQEGKKSLPVISEMNFEIRKGELIALTGPSGCGKTTVLLLLMGLYSLDRGRRFLCMNSGEIPLTAAYRRMFAFVPQGNMLMNGSIRDVVTFSEAEADEERLHWALSMACADEFADDLNRVLGEEGTGLSEGQKQRLALARAIYSTHPILLLDEATSALDERTERQVLGNLRKMTGKTIVIVTHRKTALDICDRVVSLEPKVIAVESEPEEMP